MLSVALNHNIIDVQFTEIFYRNKKGNYSFGSMNLWGSAAFNRLNSCTVYM